uniref:Uncharacterized protein n=1 Tax=Alexandrium catenella TaxID=2925 RepID=A0A7S1WUS5_ALECA|mmetsp:Transcript_91299/g.242521  ORF Transcript_91299/g.242521 Transcript_91299/m.242521 type:complete len:183 (+) Transcript_91299:105-653(+)
MAFRSAPLLGALLAWCASLAAAARASELNFYDADAACMIQRTVTSANLTVAQDGEVGNFCTLAKIASEHHSGTGCIDWAVECPSGYPTGGGCDIDTPGAVPTKSHPTKAGWHCEVCAVPPPLEGLPTAPKPQGYARSTAANSPVAGKAFVVCCSDPVEPPSPASSAPAPAPEGPKPDLPPPR